MKDKITDSYLIIGHSVSVVDAGAEVLRSGKLNFGMIRRVIGRRRRATLLSKIKKFTSQKLQIFSH